MKDLVIGVPPTRKKEGLTQAKIILVISYGRRIPVCEQYNTISPKFAKMMHHCFSKTFDLNINPHVRQVGKDRDPSQKYFSV